MPDYSKIKKRGFQAVPSGSANGTVLGEITAGSTVRFYLADGESVTFTIATAAPTSAPSLKYTISKDETGPNWDETLSMGMNIYVTAKVGSPLFRVI